MCVGGGEFASLGKEKRISLQLIIVFYKGKLFSKTIVSYKGHKLTNFEILPGQH